MFSDPDYRPILRNIEPIAVVLEGRQVIALKDPLSLADGMVCVPREAVALLALLDGRHSLRDIQTELSRDSGRIVFLDDILGLLHALDESFLLEGDRFVQAYRQKTEDYRKNGVRYSSHAGTCYSDDPDELRSELLQYFTADDGPGEPRLIPGSRRPIGLIVPHIDIRSGGKCFAQGYHALAACPPADIYVILGTGHAGVQGMFTATTLDFQTPFGTVQTDREFLSELGRRLGRDPAAEEILHATEHVIEFQIIFLQLLFAQRHPFTIVPILCSLSPHIFNGSEYVQEAKAWFDEMCRALKETARSSSKSVCFIASADLDHVGPRYGDSFIPHKATVSDTLEKDSELLSFLERGDLDAFISTVSRNDDTGRICGFSPITTMLHAVDAASGRLLDLDYTVVDDQHSFVSFASMIFHNTEHP